MLKKILLASALVFSMGSLSAAELKIGIVDVQKIFNKAPQVKTINEKIQKQFKEQTDAISALQKKGGELQEKGQRDAMTLTTAQKIKLQRDLQALDSEFKMKQKYLQEDVQNAKKQEQAKIMRIIQQAITKVAADGKYDLILQIEASAYASSAINISDKVIAIISNPAG